MRGHNYCLGFPVIKIEALIVFCFVCGLNDCCFDKIFFFDFLLEFY